MSVKSMRVVSFSEPREIDEAQAALLLATNAPGGLRILREVFRGTGGLRFQFANGLVIDWLDGKFTAALGDPVAELRRQ
jgi:hypothetical protein